MAKASVLMPLLQSTIGAGASIYTARKERKSTERREKRADVEVGAARAEQTALDEKRRATLQGEADAASEASAASERAKRKTAVRQTVATEGGNEGLTGYSGASGKKKLLGG